MFGRLRYSVGLLLFSSAAAALAGTPPRPQAPPPRPADHRTGRQAPAGDLVVQPPSVAAQLGDADLAEDLRLFFPNATNERRDRVFRQIVASAKAIQRANGRRMETHVESIAENCVTMLGDHPRLRAVLALARARANAHEPTRGEGNRYVDQYFFYEVMRAGAYAILDARGTRNLDIGEDLSPSEASPSPEEDALRDAIKTRMNKKKN